MFTLKFAKRISFSLCLLMIAALLAAQAVSAQINIGGFNIPKPKRANKPKTDQSGQTKSDGSGQSGSSSSNDSGGSSPNDVQINPKAPDNYDANLNVGDQAVAVTHFRDLKQVRILAKSGGAYKTAELANPSTITWYKANSVYPYFDSKAFSDITFDNKQYITPFLACYAQKHNVDEGALKGDGFWGRTDFGSADDARKELKAQQPNMLALSNQLKAKFPNMPDTFLTYQENPAVWSDISAHSDEYIQCVAQAIEDKPSPVLPVFLDDIEKAKAQAEQYTPETMLYVVPAGGQSEALLRAVSKKAREEWAAQWLKQPAMRKQFDAAWDELAAVAAKKLPLYKPSPESFKFRFPAGEKLVMNSFKSLATIKIFRSGTDTAGWDIQKNDIGLPSYRYKDVRVYFRDTSDDHPYCRVVSARVKQDYAGGGTYSTATYRSSVEEELFGCP